MDSWRAWARVGHRLGERATWLIGRPTDYLIWPADEEHYVQWHGEADDAFYAEAASGRYDDTTLLPDQIVRLRALGWVPPGEGAGGVGVLNWSRWWDAPVPIYDVVLLTVRTLAEVFSARPEDILEGIGP